MCRVCGAYDFAREEIWHRSNQCPGRADSKSLVDEVTVVPKAGSDQDSLPPRSPRHG